MCVCVCVCVCVYRALESDVEVRDPEILDVLRQVVTAPEGRRNPTPYNADRGGRAKRCGGFVSHSVHSGYAPVLRKRCAGP